MLRQSGLFGVISSSKMSLSMKRVSKADFPISVPSGKIKIPFLASLGITELSKPSSSREQSIPLDSTPRSFPFLIFTPPATIEPWRATGTMALSKTFGAPVTICKTSSPTFTEQTTSLSASGCFSIFSIFPTTILSKPSDGIITDSTWEPELESPSASFFTSKSKST